MAVRTYLIAWLGCSFQSLNGMLAFEDTEQDFDSCQTTTQCTKSAPKVLQKAAYCGQSTLGSIQSTLGNIPSTFAM